jgi:hypothetical protein
MASFIPELSTGSNGVYSDENKENRPEQQEKVHKVAQKVDLKPAERRPLARSLNAQPRNNAGGRISEQALGKAIVECIDFGHLDKAKTLLETLGKGRLQQSFVDEGVNKAAFLGHLESIKLLLAYGELSEKARGQAVIKAVKISKTEIVQYLLSNGFIDEIYRGRALKEAKKTNNQEMLEILDNI